ncbi:MAG: protein-export chaperone SecB [Gallionellales bacterium GWA2_60_142]|jgi:preprotein translocase subunit SecB|nr:MAG: protein-export chaperone SecB [Gallionellales bacterium GWA2_60_142]HCI12468.1 protein-export chaperone SecB [Gallionellaceae bacterium]
MTEAAQQNTQPLFNMEKIYVKDLSLEIPNAPQIFLERENPQIDVQLATQAASIDDGVFEVSVTSTVTAKVGEKVMFLIEAKQAGIFQMRNIPAEEMEPILAVMCPNILFPYLREVVSDVAVRAGFAPVLLNPINFDVLYQQQKQQQAQAAAATPATTH